jgi:hypothetical protein
VKLRKANMNKIVKRVSDLTPDDFRKCSIWSWYENVEDESLVMPVEEEYLLSSDYDPLFILSELILCDGTKLQGEIALKLSTREVYMLGFFRGDEIFTFSLHPALKGLNTLERVSNWLQKPIKEISPIRYITPYVFNDGSAIVGEIDLIQG